MWNWNHCAVYTMIIINHAFYVILGSQCAGKKVLGGAENKRILLCHTYHTLGCAACLSTVAFSCSYTTKTGRRTFWTHCSVLNNLNYKNMPKLVLHYFDFPFWRAEVCRLALHLGKVSAFSVYFLLFPYPKNFSQFFSSHWKK